MIIDRKRNNIRIENSSGFYARMLKNMIIHHKDNNLYSKSVMVVDDEIDTITIIRHLLQVNNNNNFLRAFFKQQV